MVYFLLTFVELFSQRFPASIIQVGKKVSSKDVIMAKNGSDKTSKCGGDFYETNKKYAQSFYFVDSGYLPTYLPTYPPTYLPTHLPTYLPTYLPSTAFFSWEIDSCEMFLYNLISEPLSAWINKRDGSSLPT